MEIWISNKLSNKIIARASNKLQLDLPFLSGIFVLFQILTMSSKISNEKGSAETETGNKTNNKETDNKIEVIEKTEEQKQEEEKQRQKNFQNWNRHGNVLHVKK